MQTYVELLIQELVFWSDRLADPVFETVYFGGGTPSLLPARDVEHILTTVSSRFHIAPHAEITLEANPESANDGDYLRTLRALGVNRLSLGVQSLDHDQLNTLGRIHSPEQALQTLDKARHAGFSNTGLDFIWGIPGQTRSHWLGQLERVAELRPDHFSCYGLTVEPGTPLEQDLGTGSIELPSEDDQAAMFLEGSALLQSHGYTHYEISNFCRDGKHSRHNTGYWQGKDYLGVGPAAVSTISNVRWTHPDTLGAYATSLAGGQLGTNREPLAPTDLFNEQIMLSLRTAQGLDLGLLRQEMFAPPVDDPSDHIESLIKHGLAYTVGNTLSLTPAGMLVSNEIIAGFLRPTDNDRNSHPTGVSA